MRNRIANLRRGFRTRIQTRLIDPQRLLVAQAAMTLRRSHQVHYRFLFDAELQVFSQWGEDGILDFLCDSLGLCKPRILELGAGNLLECNSRYLLEARNASVVAVDARADLVSTAHQLPGYWRSTLIPIVTWITPVSVAPLQALTQDRLGGLDIVSIDIDGNDYWVARMIDWSQVRIVVVEYNPIFGSSHPVSVPRDDGFDRGAAHFSNLYFGASLPAWISFFRSHELTLVGTNRVGNNAFFVRQSERSRVPVAEFDSAALEVAVDWRVREARNPDGELSYQSWRDASDDLMGLPLVDVDTGLATSVRNVLGRH